MIIISLCILGLGLFAFSSFTPGSQGLLSFFSGVLLGFGILKFSDKDLQWSKLFLKQTGGKKRYSEKQRTNFLKSASNEGYWRVFIPKK